MTPPREPHAPADLTALRAHRDALESEAHQLKVKVKALRETLTGSKRREREVISAEITEMKALRAALDAQVAAMSDRVSALMRATD